MRQNYNQESVDFWKKAYVSHQTGSGYYAGQPYQRGAGIGSFFRGLFRSIFPIVKSVGKEAAKQAVTAGVGLANDYLAGDNIKTSIKRRGKQALGNTLETTGKLIKDQQGEGIGTRKRLTRDIFN